MRKKFSIIFLLSFFYIDSYSQTITNKSFNYFDLLEIENKDYQHQIIVSATMDEIGYQGQCYKIKQNYFSFQFGASFKRNLIRLASHLVEPSVYFEKIFPTNGITGSFGFRWYFNQRKFSFIGIRLYSGYFWTSNKIGMPNNNWGQNRMQFELFWTNSFRTGSDIMVGRKFVNKFISEISVIVGYRMDQFAISYECLNNCPINSIGINQVEKGTEGLPHFQVIFGFDLHRKSE